MTHPASTCVIEFPRDRLRPVSRRTPADRSAEVLIFTGVRIERLPPGSEHMPKTRGALTRKDRGSKG